LKRVTGLAFAALSACVNNGSSGSGGHGAGAGPAPTQPVEVVRQGPRSGSRLKAQYFVGADGSKAYAGMYDAQTEKECAFVTAADGAYRCLPSGPGVIASTAYYADATCTRPILSFPKVCSGPPYVSTFETKCSGTTVFHVFPTSGPFAPGASVYLSAGGACAPIPTVTIPGAWIGTGTEAAPSTFVQASLEGD
jgi:hypothetical protein